MLSGNIKSCPLCRAVFGAASKEEVKEYLVPEWDEQVNNSDFENARYYDFVVTGVSCGIRRFRGWRNPSTKRVLQIG